MTRSLVTSAARDSTAWTVGWFVYVAHLRIVEADPDDEATSYLGAVVYAAIVAQLLGIKVDASTLADLLNRSPRPIRMRLGVPDRSTTEDARIAAQLIVARLEEPNSSVYRDPFASLADGATALLEAKTPYRANATRDRAPMASELGERISTLLGP